MMNVVIVREAGSDEWVEWHVEFDDVVEEMKRRSSGTTYEIMALEVMQRCVVVDGQEVTTHGA